MAACYLLGVKSVTSKKSGKTFYPVTLLTRNNFGDWETRTAFCADEGVYQTINESCSIGDPVVCSLDMTGNLIQCVSHDSFPPLQLFNGSEQLG